MGRKRKNVNEALKKKLLSDKKDIKPSSEPNKKDIDSQIQDDSIAIGFFDNEQHSFGGLFQQQESQRKKDITEQARIISEYRTLYGTPEVSMCVDEITDASVFDKDGIIIKIDFDSEIKEKTSKTISAEFDTIKKKINISKNIGNLFRSFYVDGQLNINVIFDNKDLSSGLKYFNVLSPYGLFFNKTKKIWEYQQYTKDTNNANKKDFDISFTEDEIVRIDSGLYSGNTILSNLNSAIKPANMLKTLEDLLIPMRFSRSMSRRVFNVDVGNLTSSKAEASMSKIQTKFKYKKFYDSEKGTVTNNNHIHSMVEDYWFPNRDGSRGTTVDTIDETGNLGEIGDILYFKRKLYSALKVPTSRINDPDIDQSEFEIGTTNVSRDEMKFFSFINRQQNLFLELFYELLRRQLIAKKIMSDDDWLEIKDQISIKFNSVNHFYKTMELENLQRQVEIYTDMEELIGKEFSKKFMRTKIFEMTEDEIKEMQEQIEEEKKDEPEEDRSSRW